MGDTKRFWNFAVAGSWLKCSKSVIRVASLIGFIIVVSGCAAVLPKEESQFFSGNMDGIVRHLEPRYEAGKKIASDQLVFLCLAYKNKSIISKAFKCADDLEKAIAKSTDNRTFGLGPFSSAPWLIRAEASLATGNYRKAIEFANAAQRKALAEKDGMVGNQMVWIYRPVSTRAIAYSALGKSEKASKELQKLENTQVSFFGGALARQALRTELFKVYLAMEKWESYRAKAAETDPMFALGRPLVQATWGQELDTEEQVRNQFAAHFVSLKLGNIELAKQGFESLLRNRSTENFGSIHWKILYFLGVIYDQTGKTEKAIERLSEAVNVIERQRSQVEGEASKIGFIGDKQNVYRDIISVLVKAGRAEVAFEYAERGKARALVDLLASKKSFGGSGDASKIASMLSELDRLEKESLTLASAGTGSVTRGIKATMKALTEEMPEVASLVSVAAEKPSAVKSLLRPDEAIVEYFYQAEPGKDADNLFAFVVTRGGVQAFTLKANGLNDDVRAFRAAINNYQSNGWSRWSSKLHERLIKPLEGAISGKRHLTIVPHGALHYLPFNVLKAKGGKFLIEGHTVRLLPSASVLKFLNKKTKPTLNLLVFGNPDLNNPSMDLPGAQSEAKAIAALWPKSKVVLRKHASESIIKKVAGAFKYLHLASHGQFDPDDPLKSRMLLAPDNDNDGNLTVPEIYDLRLNADMVVLSACQTALGDVKNGDDVVGLNRGFLYAGAKSIVGSLWEVPDDPTKDLMLDLYKNLKSMGLREAMQLAQLAGLRKYKHPIAWGAFQITGGT